MDQTVIHEIRHGQTPDNVKKQLNSKEDPLTDLGVQQAIELGKKLKKAGHVYDEVLVSPLLRAEHTAQLVALQLGLYGYHTLPDLGEREFGDMVGLPYAKIAEMDDIVTTEGATYFLSGGGAETFQELFERAQRVLKEIKEKYAGKKILVVTHGDIGKMLYAAYYGRDIIETLRLFRFGNAQAIVLAEDSSYEDVYLNLEQ